MLRIKEEMAESVDDLKSSRSNQGYTQFQNFENLDARIASSLNTMWKDIANLQIKRLKNYTESQFKEEETGSVGKLSTVCTQDCSEKICIWFVFVDLIFYGP